MKLIVMQPFVCGTGWREESNNRANNNNTSVWVQVMDEKDAVTAAAAAVMVASSSTACPSGRWDVCLFCAWEEESESRIRHLNEDGWRGTSDGSGYLYACFSHSVLRLLSLKCPGTTDRGLAARQSVICVTSWPVSAKQIVFFLFSSSSSTWITTIATRSTRKRQHEGTSERERIMIHEWKWGGGCCASWNAQNGS
jgi:hypothetical protein